MKSNFLDIYGKKQLLQLPIGERVRMIQTEFKCVLPTKNLTDHFLSLVIDSKIIVPSSFITGAVYTNVHGFTEDAMAYLLCDIAHTTDLSLFFGFDLDNLPEIEYLFRVYIHTCSHQKIDTDVTVLFKSNSLMTFKTDSLVEYKTKHVSYEKTIGTSPVAAKYNRLGEAMRSAYTVQTYIKQLKNQILNIQEDTIDASMQDLLPTARLAKKLSVKK